VWLRKARGESSIGPHWWPHDGAAIEVPDELGHRILAIQGHDFTRLPGEPEPEPAAPEPAAAKTPAPAKAAS
jgi:hypothetical protein